MYKVIIADDKALIRAGLFYRNDWKQMGYEVVAMLEDGSDVLEFLEKERADVLLADICMYSVSGLEAAKVIQEKYPWMKVVLISGYQDFDFAKEAIRYRVYDYLLKPIDYEKLRNVFASIKMELDQAKKAEILRSCFHEQAYDQVLYLLQRISGIKTDKKQSWQDYTELWKVFKKTTIGVNEYVGMEMMELLEKELHEIDTTIWSQFEKKLLEMETASEEMLLMLLRQLEQMLEERGLLEAKIQKDEEIMKACAYIKEHLEDNLPLEKVAEHIHLSTRQFTRRFYQQMGENYKEYLFRIRMETAVNLLEQGNFSLDEICTKVGYKDYKYFSQLFRKYTGDRLRKR